MPSIVKKRPAAADACTSRKRPAAKASQTPQLKLRPAAASPVTIPTGCLKKILEFWYKGALDNVEMNLYVDSYRYDGFAEELHGSNVPANLRGRVLKNGSVLLCSRQLPLIDRVKGASQSLGIAEESFAQGTASEVGGYFLFRELRNQLQARPLFLEDTDESPTDTWRHYRWKTIGKILQHHYPIAALSKYWYRCLCQVATCNYKYMLTRHTKISGCCEFGDHPGEDLIVCARGEAPESVADSNSEEDTWLMTVLLER